MPSWLTSLAAKIVGGLLLTLLLGGGLTWAINSHDNAVLARAQAREDAAIATAIAVNTANSLAALDNAHAALEAAQAEASTLRMKYHAAPRSKACLSSPAVGVYLNGLRARPNGAVTGR